MKRKISSILRIGMEGRFQTKGGEAENNDQFTMNSKRPTMTLNVNGLWDVVPRLDHYRLSRRAKRPSLAELHEGNPAKYRQEHLSLAALESGVSGMSAGLHGSVAAAAAAASGAHVGYGGGGAPYGAYGYGMGLHGAGAACQGHGGQFGRMGGGGGQAQQHEGIKLGWIQGVLIPCLLNIWGVMLFLRLSWVVAQAGVLHTFVIIGISALVCVITTLSLSAISTNGEVKGGGIYFIISRSLGPEFGASVGIVFAFANAVAASMNTIGFCDSFIDLLKDYDLQITDDGPTQVRIIGIIAILVMTFICAVGMEWESKAQNFLIAIIIGAIFDFLVGALIGPTTLQHRAAGFSGFSRQVFEDNWLPDYRYSEGSNQTFFSVFAIFFPSVTGIQAGANISGDLKDPASSIPIGTLLALLISMASYATFVLFAGGAAIRDASGLVSANGTIAACQPPNCASGIHNSYTMMQLMSWWGPFIYAGCWAATLSTALTNLLSVPRLIQALGQDRIYPGLIFFSKGYGKSGEPYRGYVLTFFVAALFVLIANLNAIAPLISNFYLASYALINFCTFHAALVRPLGWRPTFKYYNTWLSLVGFIGCVAIMFLIDWVTSLLTFVIIFALYLIVVYRKPDVNWGSSTQAQTYKTALSIAYRLNSIDEHVKNYCPQILALSGAPHVRPALVHLANLITKNNSLLICGEIYPLRMSYRMRSAHMRKGYAWLQRHRIKSFYHVVEELSLEMGASAMMQTSGVGKLAPNVVLMGYKTEWSSCNYKDLQEYFNVLHNAFDHRLAVAILRIAEGLDSSNVSVTDEENQHQNSQLQLQQQLQQQQQQQHQAVQPQQQQAQQPQGVLVQSSYDLAGNTLMHADSDLSMSGRGMTRVQSVPTIGDCLGSHYVPPDAASQVRECPPHFNTREKNKKKHIAEKMLINNKQNGLAVVPEYTTIFQKKHKNGTIDVWWLYDDGGLTILLPYIISTRSNWEHCKMRIFALANHKQDLGAQEKEMAEIMAKFRIKYQSLKMVDDISVQPRPETQKFFDNVISDFRKNESNDDNECIVTDAELANLRDKTHRQLRLRELLQENSSQSTLVVMSLPMPRKGAVSAPLYMAWLEALTRDLPPTLLIRGNHSSVLTFYS